MEHTECAHCHGEGKISRRELMVIGAGGLLLILGIALPDVAWLKIVIFTLAYLVAGGEVLLAAGRDIAHGRLFDENFLMGLATLGAFAIGEFPEAVAVMLFYRVGELFQSYAVDRSKRSIRAMLEIRPERATVVRGINVSTVPPEEVGLGETILIKPGERIPLDAKILEGTSTLDTAALTGESLPRDVAPGAMVLSGCINLTGTLHARVMKTYEDSTVSEILRMMEEESEKKAKTEGFITRFARVYTPVVVGIAVLLALVPPLLLDAAWMTWIYRALVFLMISCPCALVLSVPLSFFCGLGSASRVGILVRGGNYLEALAKADTVVFDKTGTLTEGKFTVREIYPVGMSESAFLTLAAYAESNSNHPIAKSICAAYTGAVARERIGESREIPGRGVAVQIDGRMVLAGNLNMMHEAGIQAQEVDGSAVHLAVDGTYLGYLVVADREKPDAAQTIAKLHAAGVRKTVMLSGDVNPIARPMGEKLGLSEVVAELLPEGKVQEMERLAAQGEGTVVFVGDGINDAPALARADVGVAMGALGADAAIEAADVVIMTDEPGKLVDAIAIAKKTSQIVRQNVVFSLGVKGFVLLLSVFGLTGMWQAVFADVGVSILAVLNATRAFRR